MTTTTPRIRPPLRFWVAPFAAVCLATAGCHGPDQRVATPTPTATPVAKLPAATTVAEAEAPTPTHSLDFGHPLYLSDQTRVIDIDAVMRDPAAYLGRDLVLAGTIADVCQKRGCWMTLGSDTLASAVMVKFTCPIDGFLIPPTAAGHDALATGRLELREISEAYARHLAQDNGLPPEAIQAIVGPQQMLWLAAPSARVFGFGADSAEGS